MITVGEQNSWMNNCPPLFSPTCENAPDQEATFHTASFAYRVRVIKKGNTVDVPV